MTAFTTLKNLVGLCLVFLGFSIRAKADTISLTTVADTSIFQNNPLANLGAATLVSGTNQQFSRSRALFRFDLSSIPAGATITDAAVTLSVVRRPDPDQHGGPRDSDFGLYKLLVGWGEGAGSAPTGSSASPGDATWITRFYPDVLWNSPGGDSGTDYVETPSSSAFISGLGDYTFGSTSSLVDDVQSWVDNPALNFGYMLISSDEGINGTGRRIASLEQVLTGSPAQILITFTVPEPSVVLLAGGGLFALAVRRRRR